MPFLPSCTRDRAEGRGRQLAAKLKGSNPSPALSGSDPGRDRRQNHRARERFGFAQNVTAKCYGGDITRKRKLLEKQKEGKKRMKSIGQYQYSAGSIY